MLALQFVDNIASPKVVYDENTKIVIYFIQIYYSIWNKSTGYYFSSHVYTTGQFFIPIELKDT